MADLIDRQEAIDVVRKWFALIGLNGDICIDGITSLPAAESEIKDRLDSAYAHGYTEAEAHFYKALQSRPEIIRCSECKHNPKRSWFGCPMSGLNERQRPETAWCWKGERESDGRPD